jgi:surface protein
MIDPLLTNTVRVGQLPAEVWSGTDNLPHEVGSDLKRGSVADLATYIAGVVNASSGIAFNPLKITNGQTLPITTTNEWLLVGAGTYLQGGGFADVVCTNDINIVTSNGVSWAFSFGIDIADVDLSGLVDTVSNQTIDGVKTFIQAIIVPNATQTNEAVNLGQLSEKADLVNGLVPSSQLPSYVDDITYNPTTGRLELSNGNHTFLPIAITDHTQLTNIGANTHAQIDAHIGSTSNPHGVTKGQVGLGNVVNADTTTTANITDSLNKRFITDLERTEWNNWNNLVNDINDNIDLIVGAGTITPNERPIDWLDIESLVTEGETKIVGLHSVYNANSNYVTVQCTTSAGQYSVNWGNGVTTSHNSGTTAERLLNYADYAGTETLYYRQAIITVTGAITGVNFTVKHSAPSLPSPYGGGWLDIKMSGALISSLVLYNASAASVKCNSLFGFNWVGNNAITNGTNLFRELRVLKKVNINTTFFTNMQDMFLGCSSLQSVPLFNTQNVSNMVEMFFGCSSLQSVPLFNTQNVGNMQSMFQSCTSLQTVPLFNTQNVNTMQSMFNSCSSLQSVPLFNTQNVSNMAQMFFGCSSLQSVPLFNTQNVSNMAQMFFGCSSLQSIPAWIARTAGVSYGSFVSGCPTLQSCGIVGIPSTISFASCKLSTANIIAIFNNLATVAITQTITVTGNVGTAGLTAPDIAIATNKNWIVTT